MSAPAAEGTVSGIERVGSALLVLGGLAAWETLARTATISPTFFPPPTVILGALFELVRNGEVSYHGAVTLGRVVVGFGIGAGAGLLLGLAMGAWPRLHALLDPIVALFHPIPKIAVLPLILVVFGIDESSKIALAALGAFFPMLLNTVAGVRQISPTYFEVARSYGAGRRHTFTRVVLPGSLPLVLTGARLSVNVALMLTIAGELVVAQSGLGEKMWFAWQTMHIADVYAWLFVISAVGLALNRMLAWISRRFMPWSEGVVGVRRRLAIN